VVDAINDSVEQLLAPVPGGTAIVLNQMKTGLGVCFVVAVRQRPFRSEIGTQISVHRGDFGRGEHLVVRSVGGLGGLHDHLVEAVGGLRAGLDVLPVRCTRQAEVAVDVLDDLVETGAGRAMGGGGNQAVGLDTGRCGHCGLLLWVDGKAGRARSTPPGRQHHQRFE